MSDTYINSYTKHTWECNKGHRWEATPSQIIHQGQWCAKCSGNAPKTYEELENIVKKKEGKLLTPFQKYNNGQTKVKIQCNCGYKWKPLASSIFQGKWCPKCGKSIRIPFEKIQEEAKKRGGICLSSSDKYENNKSKLNFECACGNKFVSYWNNIQQGRWCPNCTSSREERTCRAIFEQFFSTKFISYWPEWLKNDEGKILELDGYNKDLQIAFEYQGRQHYQLIDKFHAGAESLKKRIRDDEIKKSICEKKGIRLFNIKYIEQKNLDKTVKYIFNEIVQQCKKYKIQYDINLKYQDIDIYEIYRTPLDLYKLKELVELAASKGGMILNKEYKGVLHKYDWKCLVCGNEWEAKANDVKNTNTWCPKCGYRKVSEKMKLYKRNSKKNLTNGSS